MMKKTIQMTKFWLPFLHLDFAKNYLKGPAHYLSQILFLSFYCLQCLNNAFLMISENLSLSRSLISMKQSLQFYVTYINKSIIITITVKTMTMFGGFFYNTFFGSCNLCGLVFQGCIYYNEYIYMYCYCCPETKKKLQDKLP